MRRCILVVSLVFLACSHALFAQAEQNGLQIEVSRKTMSRDDSHNAGFYEQQINRTMALHVTVKNVSMKPFPEGEIVYSLLVHKVYTYPNRVELYTGTVKLPALQTAEEKDVVIGSAQVNGYRDLAEQHKDKLDYKVVIKYAGKEAAMLTSSSGFDAAAEHAVKMSK